MPTHARGNLGQGDRGYNNCTKYDAMEAFDRLPKAVREVLRNSDHNWSAAQLYREYKRGKRPEVKTAAACVAFIKSQDAKKHREDAEKGLVAP